MDVAIGFLAGVASTLAAVCAALIATRTGRADDAKKVMDELDDEAATKAVADRRNEIMERAHRNPANRTMFD